ncbi:hypothetical protein PMAYCL1PPCAC_13331 [Pristionchus mayeri]|uniref:BTB domain-containing protein n=1 Tax=Pristionchus mayeri TaxID=1317129 RepID=A0AAN4ZQC2_9BILA|nr:hypothetical protein PMAYCL1PPCAC_13331 [Pristionchus mayeri]
MDEIPAHRTAKRPRAPEDLIVFCVPFPEKLDNDGVYSEQQTISGFPWRANVSKEEDEDGIEYLGLFLHCEMNKHSSVWFCDVSYEMTLVNQRDALLSETIKQTHRFDYSEGRLGIGAAEFITMEKLLNPNEGFIKDNMIRVEVKVTVNNSSLSRKFRGKPHVDLFSPSPQADAVLIVDSFKLYVNKQLLAIQSQFFDRLFNGQYKESKQKEIHIEDVDINDFEELLKAMYPIEYEYTEDNVESILELADRFEVNSVLNSAEKFLLADTEMSPRRKLLLADKYKLTVLIDQCLSMHKTCAQMKGLKSTPEYPLLSDAVKGALFDLITNICKC